MVCVWSDEGITIANPGDFRMPIEEARKPGSTDPRNEAMMRMFSMVEIGERAGSGMDKIFGGWEWAGYPAPTYEVAYGPDRTPLMLPLVSADSTSDGRQKSAEMATARQNRRFLPISRSLDRRSGRSLRRSPVLERRG